MKGDVDASLRQLRGYIRLYKDPPIAMEGRHASISEDDRRVKIRVTRLRVADLVVAEFGALDEALSSGERVPEEWDRVLGNTYRTRFHTFPHTYVFPPGWTGRMCAMVEEECDWLRVEGGAVVCARCHTIRFKVTE